jgi:hypothetical protein
MVPICSQARSATSISPETIPLVTVFSAVVAMALVFKKALAGSCQLIPKMTMIYNHTKIHNLLS